MGTIKLKQFLSALFFLITTFHTGFSQENTGKIKSIIVYEERFDALLSKKITESETYYDVKGNIIEEKAFGKDGKLTSHFRYQYNENNNKIKEEEFDATGKLIERSEYKIENGLRVSKTVYDRNNRIILKKIYQYTTF